jgi:hypothetical protein
MNWKQFQAAFQKAGLYKAKIDGDAGELTWKALEAFFGQLALAGRLADGWQGWSTARRKLAVEQAIMADAGIEVGEIDGLLGPQTRAARLMWEGLQKTGKPVIEGIPDRDKDPANPVPPSGPATHFPRQADMAQFFGAPGTNHAMLLLPYPMKLAWAKSQKVQRCVVNARCREAFENMFVAFRERIGMDGIKDLGLDLFGGCFNNRKMRGGTRLSTHAYAAAMDFDPERNQLKWTQDRARLGKGDAAEVWRIVERLGLVGLGPARNFDWMHIQAARL